MDAVELNHPLGFSKIMECEGFGRQAKVTGGKKKEVKETGLGLSLPKDENFRERYSEVAVNGEMIEYNDISSCYILGPWAISIGRLSHIIFILIAI
ncbi:PREDICTED: proline--tRNA ligase, cytoplasmic isoform X1 [Theobroma cacao]|uniref:Proline--tRNA ligase, cytoplasmic isoform X1 n=1 Tax=Theobroma cacao TaxID=3641 RepID=A0AB32VY06_THECC|nr:PREDICTED: proline--tRNA ligase, cytoplasmic isoform X1 [Theobroma cacao]